MTICQQNLTNGGSRCGDKLDKVAENPDNERSDVGVSGDVVKMTSTLPAGTILHQFHWWNTYNKEESTT